jgi:hypothetical protein
MNLDVQSLQTTAKKYCCLCGEFKVPNDQTLVCPKSLESILSFCLGFNTLRTNHLKLKRVGIILVDEFN